MIPHSVRRAALLLVLVAAPLGYFSTAFAFRSPTRDQTNTSQLSDLPYAQASACYNTPPTTDPSPTVCISRMTVSFNGTSPDNQFYVSWRSLKPETGSVVLSTGETFDDVRGSNYKGQTHYAPVNNLAAKTTYQFDVVSGGQTYTNGGAHWSVKMGPVIAPVTPYVIIGRVKNPDGSDADGTLVYAQVRNGDGKGTTGRSGLLSGLIIVADGGGFFNINLEEARSASTSQNYAFDPEADRVLVVAAGAQGTASQVFTISDLHPPKPPPSLILNNSGVGSAVTATATLLPPTETPTPSPTATFTATPVSPTPTPTLPPPSATREPSPTATQAAASPTSLPASTLEAAAATGEAQSATEVAASPGETSVASAAGEEVEPPATRISRGVPQVIPPPEPANNTLLFVGLAFVLFVGAVLLGLAAYFVRRR